ncbi:MAG: glycosyltransferase [Terracidiphilus sp.]|jgi:rhamnosyl/mannosyltransferase
MVSILHVNKLYAPWIGGVEMVVQNIAEGLQAFPDVHCEVLVCRDRGASITEYVNGVRVTRVASLGTAMSMPVSPSFPFRLAKMASQFDIVHVHTPFPLAFFCDWDTVKANGTRLVVHYHSDIIRRLQRTIVSSLWGLESRFLKSADRIVVTSEGLLNSSRTLATFRDKCRVIPLFMDLRTVETPSEQEKSSARRRYGVTDSDHVVLFAGRLVYYKGVEYFIDAVRELDVQVLIAGEGPLRQTLQKRLESLGLQHRVKLLGRVSDAELSSLYSLADLFVLPSTQPSEAFGLVQLEAMAHGLPVVNTNLPSGVPSVSQHGVTGMTVPPGDSAALRDAISTILSDESLRNLFASNARERIQLFSSSVVLRQIRSLYEELEPEAAPLQ